MRYKEVHCELKLKNSFLKNISSDLIDSNTLYLSNNEKNVTIREGYLNFINNSVHANCESRALNRMIMSELIKLENFSMKSATCIFNWIKKYYSEDQSRIYSKFNIDSFIEKELMKYDDKFLKTSLEDIKKYIQTIPSSNVREIASLIIENANLNDVIYAEESNLTCTQIRKTSKLNFKLEFDNDYLLGKSTWEAKDYNFLIIDGFIDKISEIYHLLHKASENKEPYVIFCKGMSDEVKNTIVYNLKRGTINVMPINLTINEDNINVLNDVAACHDSDIVSAMKGDTISAFASKDLNKGKFISVHNDSFSFKCISNKRKEKQKRYLQKKLDNSELLDPNKKFIKNRIKNLNSNKIVIYMKNNMKLEEKKFLDSFLKSLVMFKNGIVRHKKTGEIYSYDEMSIIVNKFKSLIKNINSVGCSVNIV